MEELLKQAPLSGLLCVDVTRMLPGAVLARNLLALGARLIKIEAPKGGDPLRGTPPLAKGMGAGFALYYAGAESRRLDLRDRAQLEELTRMLERADIFVESFRRGTLARWGLDLESIERVNPGLITLSLPGWPQGLPGVGHDLNFVGRMGLYSMLPGSLRDHPGTLAQTQFADIGAGTLALSSIMAALLSRTRSGHGARLEQPLATGPLPFLAWPMAEESLGGQGATERLLSGRLPCYRCYRCADQTLLSVGCLEPKFWIQFCQAIGLPEQASAAFDDGVRGQAAIAAVEERLSEDTATRWVERLDPLGLPVDRVATLSASVTDHRLMESNLYTDLPSSQTGNAPARVPSVGVWGSSPPTRPAPALGEHDTRIAAEFGPREHDLA